MSDAFYDDARIGGMSAYWMTPGTPTPSESA
jgi:hypothetical protein